MPFLEHLWQDLRFALRQLSKTPGFTATAIMTLALGMGAAVAIYAFVDAALVEPLPYPQPTRLVNVTETTPQIPRANLSYPDYLDWKRLNTVFSSLDVHIGRGYSLSTSDRYGAGARRPRERRVFPHAGRGARAGPRLLYGRGPSRQA